MNKERERESMVMNSSHCHLKENRHGNIGWEADVKRTAYHLSGGDVGAVVEGHRGGGLEEDVVELGVHLAHVLPLPERKKKGPVKIKIDNREKKNNKNTAKAGE
jgi:hypothetical protein